MSKIFRSIRVVTLLIAMFCAVSSVAQNRQGIINSIKQWGQCNNVAITQGAGNVATYGINGYSATNVPQDLLNSLKEVRQDDLPITDIHISESGNWLILCGENGYISSGIPEYMEQRLDEFRDNGEALISASFNDAGDWIVIASGHYAASDNELNAWMKAGCDSYGSPTSICISDDAAIAVFTNGYRGLGEFPSSLNSALDSGKINPCKIKISGDSWFVADEAGSYIYEM